MRRCVCLLALVAVAAALPVLADEEKPKGKKDAEKKEMEKLMNAGQVTGVLTLSGGSEAGYSIKVPIVSIQPDLGSQLAQAQRQQQLLLRQALALRNPNPLERQRQLLLLAQDARRSDGAGVTIIETQVNVRVTPADDMKVRLVTPPPAFDDKGRAKRYTAKELKELKGKENLPGYAGSRDDLKNNQIVTAYLVRQPLKKDADKEKAKNKDSDADKAKDNKGKDMMKRTSDPIVHMLLVRGEKNY